MLCSISGEEAQHPVVSPRSGCVFEKSLIENYISTSGKDPVNDEPLSVEELIPVKTAPIPAKPSTLTSIPSLLSTFQNEWDALALEVFVLRKQLHQAKQELSAALYHKDAAVRVAAKALKERDEAKNALTQLATGLADEAVTEHKEDEPGTENGNEATNENGTEDGIDISTELSQARDTLFQLHKAQKSTFPIPPDQSISVQATKSASAFKKSHLSCAGPGHVAVASPTGSVAVYNLSDPYLNSVRKLFHKGVVTALSHANIPFVAYKNKLYVNNEDVGTGFDNIIAVVPHPSLDDVYAVVSPEKWALFKGKSQVYETQLNGITTAAVHIDGLVFAAAVSGSIQIFDLNNGLVSGELKTKHATITRLHFASNGYWLLACSTNSEQSTLEVFDLRKNTVAHSIDGATDFAIDVSATVILTYDQQKLSVHRYVKKGKQWLANCCSTQLEGLIGLHQGPGFGFVAVGEDSSIYQISIES